MSGLMAGNVTDWHQSMSGCSGVAYPSLRLVGGIVTMVVVDKLTKDAHFVLVKLTHKASNIVDVYMREIVRLHGIPKTIVSD